MNHSDARDGGSTGGRHQATERVGGARVPVIVIGGAVMAVGLAVIGGWHAGAMPVVTLGLDGTAVRYNSAVCLALYGVAMLAVELGHARWAAIVSGAAAAISALTLFEFGTGAALPIDDVFGLWVPTPGAVPRMPLNAAICFALLGVGFLLVGRRQSSLRQATGVVLAWSTAAIALIALGGFVLAAPATYAWSPVAPMPPPTAVCLLLLSIGLGLLYWDQPNVYRLSWLPLPVGLLVLVSMAVVGEAVSAQQRATGQRWLEMFAVNVATDAERELQHQASALGSLTGEDLRSGDSLQRSLNAFRVSHPAFIALELRAMDGRAAAAGNAASSPQSGSWSRPTIPACSPGPTR